MPRTPVNVWTVLPPQRDAHGVEQIRAVSRATGQQVGTVQLRAAAGRVEIANLHVVQQHRRQGIGTVLMQAAISRAQQHNLPAYLEARPAPPSIPPQALVGMYQRMGFRVTRTARSGSPVMERGGAAVAQPKTPASAAVQPKMPPGPAGVVQPARKRMIGWDRHLRRRIFPIEQLRVEIVMQIMSYLADLELVQLSRVSKFFHDTMVPRSMLSNMSYEADPHPIVARGTASTGISSRQHLRAAMDVITTAFNVRNVLNSKEVIILYRVSEKGNLTATEKDRYVVPGPFWTVEKTAAWILGGMFARLPFVLVTPPTSPKNLREGGKNLRDNSTSPAIYAREILQLLSRGYTIDYAEASERPHQYRNDDKLLILRPPLRSLTHPGTMRTQLDPDIWDRDQRNSAKLIATVNGTLISAKALHTYFKLSLALLNSTIELACKGFALESSKKRDDYDDRDDGLPPSKQIKT